MNANQYISSIKNSFIAMAFVTGVDIYMTQTHYEREYQSQIGELLAISYSAINAAPSISGSPQATIASAMAVYPDIAVKELSKISLFLKKIINDGKLNKDTHQEGPAELSETYPNTKYIDTLTTPNQPLSCAAIVFQGNDEPLILTLNSIKPVTTDFSTLNYNNAFLINLGNYIRE
jgi:hypothetical protein